MLKRITTISPILPDFELSTNRRKPEVASSGAVVLSVEPAVTAPGTVSEASVILPGYVLPDDSREDSMHEGS